MENNLYELQEMVRDGRRSIEREKERLTEKMEELNGFIKLAESTDDALARLTELQDENTRLSEENADLERQLAEKEMQLSELSKLTAGVAKKSSQDDLLKALRKYINISKRKAASKRVAVKMVITEMINTLEISLPEDMAAALEALDDEQEAPKTVIQAQGDVKVQGDYNDIHDNRAVSF